MFGVTHILQGRSITMTTGETSVCICGVNPEKGRTLSKEGRVFACLSQTHTDFQLHGMG